jgi:hypothetical protein
MERASKTKRTMLGSDEEVFELLASVPWRVPD